MIKSSIIFILKTGTGHINFASTLQLLQEEIVRPQRLQHLALDAP